MDRTETGTGAGGVLIVAVAILAATAIALLAMGRVPICDCGYVSLWHGDPNSSGGSQHLSDWYSPSHIVHGLIFYAMLRYARPRWRVEHRFLAAVAIEAAWELIENTDWVINRYREATISLDYFGDSVVNSVADIVFMAIGFGIAGRAPVLVSVAIGLGFEALALFAIRDNLALNVIMLLHPMEAIRSWQDGG